MGPDAPAQESEASGGMPEALRPAEAGLEPQPPEPGPEPEPEAIQALLQLPRALGRVAWLLCLAVLITALLALMPPALRDAGWWRRLGTTLPAQAPLALLALVLAHLAALLDPDDPLLRRRLRRLRRGAAVAAVLLLLLLPLQLALLLSGDPSGPAARQRIDQQLERRYASLRAAVTGAGSVPELRERLRLLQGPPLSPQADTIPLPLVQRRLLQALERSRPFVEERLNEGLGARGLARRSFEAVGAAVPALLYGLALASLSPLSAPGARRPRSAAPAGPARAAGLLRGELEAYVRDSADPPAEG